MGATCVNIDSSGEHLIDGPIWHTCREWKGALLTITLGPQGMRHPGRTATSLTACTTGRKGRDPSSEVTKVALCQHYTSSQPAKGFVEQKISQGLRQDDGVGVKAAS